MAANLTQILNFKANFHQEFELFSKKSYANNGRHLNTLTPGYARVTKLHNHKFCGINIYIKKRSRKLLKGKFLGSTSNSFFFVFFNIYNNFSFFLA